MPSSVPDPDALVVVPAYNEATIIGQVVSELKQTFSQVLVIDDGSADGTAAVAAAAGALVVRHGINLGQGAALQTGFAYAAAAPGVDHVITFDADGQHSVQDAAVMLRTCRLEDLDVVLGSRTLGSTIDQPFRRRLLLSFALVLGRWTTGLALTDTHNGLRVLSRNAVETIRLTQCRMAYASELEKQIGTHGLAWKEIPVQVRYTRYSRSKGQTNLNAVNVLFDLLSARLRIT